MPRGAHRDRDQLQGIPGRLRGASRVGFGEDRGRAPRALGAGSGVDLGRAPGGSGRTRGPALKGIWDELWDTVPPPP